MSFEEKQIMEVKNDSGDLRLERVTRNGEPRWRICITCADDVREHMPLDGMGFMEVSTRSILELADRLQETAR